MEECIDKTDNLRICAAGKTQKGRARENNEDNYQLGSYIKQDCYLQEDTFFYQQKEEVRYCLFSVLDGMGGGDYGERCSFYGAEEFRTAFMKLKRDISQLEASCIIRLAFQAANNRIVRDSRQLLGTTGVVACLDREEKNAKFFWSGDSRGYLFRSGTLRQLTEDQSVGAICIKNGYYRETDIQYKKDRNKLTGFIGRDNWCYNFEPLESDWISLKKEDVLLLATDGVYGTLDVKGLERILFEEKEKHPEGICERLLEEAWEEGARDDMTVVVVQVL